MRDKAEVNQTIIPLLTAILIVGRAHGGGKNARFNWLFFVPIAWLCIYHICFTAPKVPSDSDIATGGVVCTFLFVASDYILLRHRQPEIRRIGQTTPTSELSFGQRLWDAACLVASSRTIGFTTQPTAHIRPVPPNVTRRQFVISQLRWMCFYVLLFDITSAIMHSFPMYLQNGPSFGDCGWLARTSIWAHITRFWTSVSMSYIGVSTVAVALGLSRPQDWPPQFGSVRNAYTVRKCWGSVWHQMLRRVVTANANGLADILHLPKSKFTTYFKLYIAFLISGIFHQAGEYMFHQNLWIGRAIPFFLMQATAIMFEDTMIGTAKRVGISASPITKLLGYFWVFVWLTITVPYWYEPNFRAGTLRNVSFKVSLTQYLWTGDWRVSDWIYTGA